MTKCGFKLSISFLLFVSGFTAAAEPFSTCPSQAFLFQQNPVQIYGVDLLTGQFELLQGDSGMPGNINGVGFNFDDRLLYGFNTTTYAVVQLDKHLKAQALPVTGLPANTTFYVGDVSQNYYWLYRKNVGLYKINLDESSDTYLQAQQIINADTGLTLTDFAFHPDNHGLYAVDNRSGLVYKISTQTGKSELLGDSGVTGTFGAGYFDVDGNYYISRNSDGKIFRIDLSNPDTNDVTAVYFAQGPFSSQNDGARCAYAPIVSADIDWGDAPDSYGTSLLNNGPRHRISENLRLGNELTDGELQAEIYPNADDFQLYDDEDGVRWANEWVAGLHQILTIEVVGNGYVHAWADWNRDGMFQIESETLMKNYWLTDGEHEIPVIVPEDAVPGESWLRIRISEQKNLSPTGGATVGEVEDHRLVIIQQAISTRYYPNKNGWVTLAFEDRWPSEGDYDFNDAVLAYQIKETWLGENLNRVDISIKVSALGGSYRSGFSVNFPTVSRSALAGAIAFKNHKTQPAFSGDLIHAGSPILQLSPDLMQLIPLSCQYFNTSENCKSDQTEPLTVSLVLNDPSAVSQWPEFPYDPFITGVNDTWRGQWLAPLEKSRVEIHLADHANTAQGYGDIWQTDADDSQPLLNRYYKTRNNLPWALLITDQWQHPKEGVSLIEAYPNFKNWAESNGEEALNWSQAENSIAEKLF